MILNKHRRSAGWNDYNRIRLASRLADVIRIQARANQQAGGHLKGSSNLTEANVRKEIATAASVCEGNVTIRALRLRRVLSLAALRHSLRIGCVCSNS
ncbi:MAG TPA: hypothetical protein VF011_09420 [Terriglobales bacterium]